MKIIYITLFLILSLQSTYQTPSTTGTTATAVTLVGGTKACSAFIFNCKATGRLDGGQSSGSEVYSDKITFVWTLTVDGTPKTITKDTDYYVESDTNLTNGNDNTDATAYSTIVFNPKFFTNGGAGKNIITCTQTQALASGGDYTPKAAADVIGTYGSALTIDQTDTTCADAPIIQLTDNGPTTCDTVAAFIQGGDATNDKMLVLKSNASYAAGSATLAAAVKTYTVVAQKNGKDSQTVTQVTLAASANCAISSLTQVSTSTETCALQILSYEFATVSNSSASVVLMDDTTKVADTKYYVQEQNGSNGKTKYIVVVQPKVFTASKTATFTLGYKVGNVIRVQTKTIAITGAQTTCTSSALTSAFSDDCTKNTLSSSSDTSKWTYYGKGTDPTTATASKELISSVAGIYIADQSTTSPALIVQQYYQLASSDCINIVQTSTDTDRCKDMTFECKTNITTPTFAWTVAPFTNKLSDKLTDKSLTIAKNTFTADDKQTLTCTIGQKTATHDITIAKAACTSGTTTGTTSSGSSILSILALLLAALLL